MTSTEYAQLSEKIDKLADKFDNTFMPRQEYDKAHEALEYRVQVIEQKMDNWEAVGRAEVARLETANGVKYDKLDARITTLDTKIDGLKDNMVLRFENQSTQQASNQRSDIRWIISLVAGLLGGSGIGTVVWYLAHLAHP